MKNRCIVIGATGAIGTKLVEQLLQKHLYQNITLLTRKNPQLVLDKFVKDASLKPVQFNFEDPEQSAEHLNEAESFFCTHGTTRAQAGSAEAFVKIDKDYVLSAARVYKQLNPNGHFFIVTATGSSPSSVLLYSKTKGEIEKGLAELQFEKLSIFRPAYLEGRPSDGRVLEKFYAAIMPVAKLIAPVKVAVNVKDVASAIIKASEDQFPESLEQYRMNNCAKSELWTIPTNKNVDVYDNEAILKLSI